MRPTHRARPIEVARRTPEVRLAMQRGNALHGSGGLIFYDRETASVRRHLEARDDAGDPSPCECSISTGRVHGARRGCRHRANTEPP